MTADLYQFFFACGRGLESALKKQLEELAAQNVAEIRGLGEEVEFHTRIQSGGVSVSTTKLKAIQVAMGTTFCSRALWHLGRGRADTLQELYTESRKIPWHQLFSLDATFSVSMTFQGENTGLREFRDAPLKIKDAIADEFREAKNARPNVSRENPDVAIFAHAAGPNVDFYVDILGKGVTKHGYRVAGSAAPFSEGLASAILFEMGWSFVVDAFWKGTLVGYNREFGRVDELSPEEFAKLLEVPEVNAEAKRKQLPKIIPLLPCIVDPMCGSATLAIEAAWLILGRNALHLRGKLGFEFLTPFAKENKISFAIRNNLLASEKSVVDVKMKWEDIFAKYNLEKLGFENDSFPLYCSDISSDGVQSSRSNVAAAGVSQLVSVQQKDFFKMSVPVKAGFCFVNPPYNERLEANATLYKEIGDRWKQGFKNFSCWAISPSENNTGFGLRPTRNVSVFNGGIACAVQNFLIS